MINKDIFLIAKCIKEKNSWLGNKSTTHVNISWNILEERLCLEVLKWQFIHSCAEILSNRTNKFNLTKTRRLRLKFHFQLFRYAEVIADHMVCLRPLWQRSKSTANNRHPDLSSSHHFSSNSRIALLLWGQAKFGMLYLYFYGHV